VEGEDKAKPSIGRGPTLLLLSSPPTLHAPPSTLHATRDTGPSSPKRFPSRRTNGVVGAVREPPLQCIAVERTNWRLLRRSVTGWTAWGYVNRGGLPSPHLRPQYTPSRPKCKKTMQPWTLSYLAPPQRGLVSYSRNCEKNFRNEKQNPDFS